jgi:hypothetical protein
MYVDILSSALDKWVTDLAGPELIEYAVICRDELRAVAPPNGGSAYEGLAAEIAYDRALIAICTERGIDAHATTFAYPHAERKRIESILADMGIDLDSPRWRQPESNEPRGVYPEGAADDRPTSAGGRDQEPPRAATRGVATSISAASVETNEAGSLDIPGSEE